MTFLKKVLALGLLTLATSPAFAAVSTYNVMTTWFEPDTQPKNSIFEGSFSYDSATKTITGLAGQLSESMTGTDPSNMTWLNLNYQLVSWYDVGLGGTFAATFRNNSTNTFSTLAGGDGWSPQDGIDIGGVYYGYPRPANNPGNAYALIFVPDDPLTALTQAQINKLAYADCAPGGMMGAVCMTGTAAAGYGDVGTMSGYPVSQVISMVTVPVPESSTYAMLSLGLAVTGMIARRRKQL